jgi:hypothetical protein
MQRVRTAGIVHGNVITVVSGGAMSVMQEVPSVHFAHHETEMKAHGISLRPMTHDAIFEKLVCSTTCYRWRMKL